MIDIVPNAAPTVVRHRKLIKLPCGSHVFIDRIKTIKTIKINDKVDRGCRGLLSVEVEDDPVRRSIGSFTREYDTVEAAQGEADKIAAAVNEYWGNPFLWS